MVIASCYCCRKVVLIDASQRRRSYFYTRF